MPIEDKMDVMLAQIAAANERRGLELREALRNPNLMTELLLRDCSDAVAAIGGYASPTDERERRIWIRHMMMSDPFFVAKVRVVENLMRQYLEVACQ